jgi:uncharacterized delta-60 repeat protein
MKNRFPFHVSVQGAICLAFILTTVAYAASGDLDTTFSGDGKIIQSFGGTEHAGRDLAVQADGKLVVVGEKFTATGSDFAIARYNTNGTLDTTFSGDGRQVVNIGVRDLAMAVAIQPDGKIVFGGMSCTSDASICDVALMRLNPNGSFDSSFDADGRLTTKYGTRDNGGFHIILLGTKILVTGYLYTGTNYNGALYLYLQDGSLDTTFSGDGIKPVDFGGQDILTSSAVYNGKIYVGGRSQSMDFTTSDIIAARINLNGTLDTTFSGDGKAKVNLGSSDLAWDLLVTGGKLVVAGQSGINLAIVKFTTMGTLDPTFSGDGILKSQLGLPGPIAVSITAQGTKLVVAGNTGGANAFLARFLSTGELDPTFSTDGIVTTAWYGIGDLYTSVLYKNSRLYATGYSIAGTLGRRFIVAAYRP